MSELAENVIRENESKINLISQDIISLKNDMDSTVNEINNKFKIVSDKYLDDAKPLTKTGRKLFEVSNLKLTPAAKDAVALEIMAQLRIKLYLTFGVSAIITILIAVAQLFLS